MFFRSLFKHIPLAIAALSVPFLCAEKTTNQVYIWGNGVYQSRPDALLQFKNFKPKLMKNLPKDLIHLEIGQYYEAGIDTNSNLYVWKTQVLDANFQDQNKKDNERQEIQLLSKNIKQVKFTTGYIWVLTAKNEVIQYPIIKDFNEIKEVSGCRLGTPRTVDPLKGSRQISSGHDHLITLSEKGQVFALGDDTYGQCATDTEIRQTFPPFNEKRVTFPVKIPFLKNIKRIASGGHHCLALDESGTLYGWGSNSNLQLSHQEQFSKMNSPLICSFKPIKISKNLDNNEIIDIKAGSQFSIIISKNKINQTFEVHTFGSNLHGQLGIGQIRHLRDVTKVQNLSNFILRRKEKQQKVEVKQLSCGKKHCIALLNIGYIMTWGDNQFGQMGNEKRSSVYSPIILKDFSQKNILGVFAGDNSSAIIIGPEPQTSKNPKQTKGK